MSDSILKDLLKEYEIKRLHAEQLAAVSYTHLTLPTTERV